MFAPLLCFCCSGEIGWCDAICSACGAELFERDRHGNFVIDGFSKAMAEAENDADWELLEDKGTHYPDCLPERDTAMTTAELTEQVQNHVSAAVELLLPSANFNTASGTGTLHEHLHALLWPFVLSASAELSAVEAANGAKDNRAKPWQYVVRFWKMLEAGPELIGETDPAIMASTGRIPYIVADLSAELHGQAPDPLCIENVKPLLPQFRNNLGRGNAATLRIPYEVSQDGHWSAGPYMCQMDVFRLNNGA